MKKSLWIVFIVLLSAAGFWYAIRTGFAISQYFHWNQKIEATITSWSIKEVKKNQFIILARYQYEYGSKLYTGEGVAGPFYPNPWAASESQRRMADHSWSVWVNQQKPHLSTLEKQFPFKSIFSASALVLLTLYFLLLGIRLQS